AVAGAAVLTSAATARRGQPVHQVLRPGADAGDAAEAIEVVIEVGRVGADVDMTAGPCGRASAVAAQDLADTLQLHPGLGCVAEDRAHQLAYDSAVAFGHPHSLVSRGVVALQMGRGREPSLVK